MRRRITALALASFLVLAMAVPGLAIDLIVDGVQAELDVKPQIIDGRTLVPLRAIFEKLGAKVDWDETTKTATAGRGDLTIALTAGSGTALVNGRRVALDVPAQIINGRTMVPVRFVSETLGARVYWLPDSRTVRVASKVYTVVRTVDGDTLEIDLDGTAEKVRLIGIDTPESVHPDASKNTEAGKSAAEYVKRMLEGREIELELDVQERDQYGRILAYVYLEGIMVNKTLLREGYAEISTFPPNVKHVEDFKAIAAERRANDPNIKKSGTYVGSQNSDKYHHPDCRYAEAIADENRVWFDTAEEASAAGYQPCGVCKP